MEIEKRARAGNTADTVGSQAASRDNGIVGAHHGLHSLTVGFVGSVQTGLAHAFAHGHGHAGRAGQDLPAPQPTPRVHPHDCGTDRGSDERANERANERADGGTYILTDCSTNSPADLQHYECAHDGTYRYNFGD